MYCSREDHYMTYVRRYKSNGGRLLNKQCFLCGEFDNRAYKHSEVEDFDSLPEYSKMLHDEWKRRDNEARREKWEEEKRAKEQERQIERKIWLETVHKPYINDSPHWKMLRQRALKRDNYTCQGCLVERATDVHHLTYHHFENELLYELVSLCRMCHDKAHGIHNPNAPLPF